jgi:hypothetical protein
MNNKLENMQKETVVAYFLPADNLRKTMKNLSLKSRSPGRDLNIGPPEYKARVIIYSDFDVRFQTICNK